jgi:Fe-S oxidoreductase
VRFRKQEELQRGINMFAQQNSTAPVKLLTTCPACVQGLSRYRDQLPVEVSYPVLELVHNLWGADWENQFLSLLKQGGIERVLL